MKMVCDCPVEEYIRLKRCLHHRAAERLYIWVVGEVEAGRLIVSADESGGDLNEPPEGTMDVVDDWERLSAYKMVDVLC